MPRKTDPTPTPLTDTDQEEQELERILTTLRQGRDTTALLEEPAGTPDDPYDAEQAMTALLVNYEKILSAKAMWKAAQAETKDLKDVYDDLLERHQALLQRFDEQRRRRDAHPNLFGDPAVVS